MNIKSTSTTKTKSVKLQDVLMYIPIDKLTFVFSLVIGAFIGMLTIGFGHMAPIIIVIIISVLAGGFGAIDSGASGFIYVLRLGIYTILVANLLILYPSTKMIHEKVPVVLVHTTEDVKGKKKIAVEVYDKISNEKIKTKYYDIDKKELVKKLYSNTAFAQYDVEYFPLIRYKRKMKFYDN